LINNELPTCADDVTARTGAIGLYLEIFLAVVPVCVRTIIMAACTSHEVLTKRLDRSKIFSEEDILSKTESTT
jgi:hypothetical protein